MTFVDEITIRLKAGKGGDGVVRWLHLKGKEFSGPAGGNGGNGGDVVARAVRDLMVLDRYKNGQTYKAENGEEGRNKNEYGANGEDLILEVPVGSVLTNKKTDEVFDLSEEGQEAIILKGGRGGLGNRHFRSSTNVRPRESTPGKLGGEANFYIEVRLVVDVGIIGLPSAGKSSLLNALTGANSKVGEYHFTTLEPHLGMLYGNVLADIPGLIRGAHEGKGLGDKFLRHIRRTKTLLHCVSLESENVVEDYETIRAELVNYDEELAEKKELVVLTKSDTVSPEVLEAKRGELAKHVGEDVLAVSIIDDDLLKSLSDTLTRILGS